MREPGNVIARARVRSAGEPIGVEHRVFDVTGGGLALPATVRTARAEVASATLAAWNATA